MFHRLSEGKPIVQIMDPASDFNLLWQSVVKSFESNKPVELS
jgi:hypothetical protein